MPNARSFDFAVKSIVTVINRRYTSSWKMNNLCYDHSYTLSFFKNGKVIYNIDSKGELTVQKGDIYLFPPGVRRSGIFGSCEPVEFITVVFDLIFFDNSEEIFRDLLYHTGNANDMILQKFTKLWQCWTNEEKYCQLICRTMLQEILYLLLVSHSKSNVNMALKSAAPIEKYIRDNFTKKISLEDLSVIANRSVSHICKMFSEAYGISPKQYILELRLNQAKKLLQNSNLSISEISSQCGFNDVFYFSRQYKLKNGISPSSERKTQIE